MSVLVLCWLLIVCRTAEPVKGIYTQMLELPAGYPARGDLLLGRPPKVQRT